MIAARIEALTSALEQIDSQPTLIRKVTNSTMRTDDHEVLSAYHVRRIARTAQTAPSMKENEDG